MARGKISSYPVNQEMLKYCKSDKERIVIETRLSCNSNKEAAQILEMDPRRISEIIKRVWVRWQTRSPTPETTKQSENTDKEFVNASKYLIEGESILYDSEGNVKLKWIKTKADEVALQDAFEKAVNNLMDKIKKNTLHLDINVSEPADTIDNELTIYPIGDLHIGMFSWAAETGEDYDLDIAYNTIKNAYKKLINSAPNTETALLINLGDFFHIDNYDGQTARNGNRLDFDTRWPKVLETGLKIMVELIYMLLSKHKKIIIRNAIGNHDQHSTIFLNAYLKAWFNNDPRIHVEDAPTAFWYYKWGKNLIGVTHGDTVKLTDLPEIMAHDAAQYWSNTEHRYWYIGHVHHMQKKEFRTCVVESFGTLVAKDAWHYASGYRSKRQIKYKVLHNKHGEVLEGTVTIN